MKRIFALAAAALVSLGAFAQNGGLDSLMLQTIRQGYTNSPADKAVRNALNAVALNTIAVNAENAAMIDTEFSDRVKTVGITDQKQSGRCWLFTGLNVLRAAAISQHDLGKFQFSQTYNFFYDQLEKANLFLQAIIDTKDLPLDDRKVDWLLSNPISDGGTWTGVANLVMKYGVVPAEVMPESFIANSTSQMATQLKTILRQDALKLREAKCPKCAGKLKVEMLSEIYRILCLAYGEPPVEFEWEGKTYTPQEFYAEQEYQTRRDSTLTQNADGVHVGDIFVACWGYDQTNYDFYQVVALKGKRTAIVRENSKRSEMCGDMTGYVRPIRDSFKDETTYTLRTKTGWYPWYGDNKNVGPEMNVPGLSGHHTMGLIEFGKLYHFTAYA